MRKWCAPALLATVLLLSSCAAPVARHNQQGNAHYADQTYDRAAEDYAQAQLDDPDRAEPYYNGANAANRLQNLDETISLTSQAIKRSDSALAADAWYNLGNAYFDAERWLDAIGAYQETLRLRPDDQQAKHNLELALRHMEQEDQEEQDQSQQDEGDTSQEQGEEGERSEEQEDESEQPSPDGSSDEQDQEQPSDSSQGESEQPDEPQPQDQPQPSQAQDQPMTEEQAQQLLQAILGDSDTLQERLQELNPAPAADTEYDW